MPIYEYQCTSCGKRLEVLKKISDPPETNCPDCNTDTLQKLVSAAGFRLKGTGWYATDFKTKPEAKPNSKGDADGGSAANSDKSEKSDSKDTATSSSSKTEASSTTSTSATASPSSSKSSE